MDKLDGDTDTPCGQIVPFGNRKRRRDHGPDPGAKVQQLQGDQILRIAMQRAEDREDEDLWTQWKAFYAMAEIIWKTMDTEFVNTPGHVCERKKCTMRHEEAMVIRFPDKDNTDLANLMGGGGLSMKNFHVCFPRYCEHYGNHKCTAPDSCPHHPRVRSEDIKSLKYIWICAETGSMHICGPYCSQKCIQTDKEGDMVCPVTGIIVTKTFGNPIPDDQLRVTGDNAGLLTSQEYESRARKKVTRGPRILLPWQRPEDMLQYRALTSIILDTLLFSEARQIWEIGRIVECCHKAHTETARSLRPKKGKDDCTSATIWDDDDLMYGDPVHAQGGGAGGYQNISIMYSLSVLSTYFPVSRYFHIAPARPSVMPLIREAIETTPILRQHITLTHVPSSQGHHECAHCRREKCRQRLREILQKLGGACPQPEPLEWESEKWQTFMKSTKNMITDVALRIWTNLNKHDYDPSKGRENMPYTKIVLAIIYLMKSEYSIPVQPHVKETTNGMNVPRVVVIPKLSVAALLPPETALCKFEMPRSCAGLVRTLTTTQRNIKDKFSSLVRQGHGYDIQINFGMNSLAQAARNG